MKKRAKKQQLHCPACGKLFTSSRGLAIHMAWHKKVANNFEYLPVPTAQYTTIAISITKDAVIINTRLEK